MSRGVRAYGVAAEAHTLLPVPGTNMAFCVPIDRVHAGCRGLIQRVLHFAPGASPEVANPAAEDVIYVLRGSGQVRAGGHVWPLAAHMAVLIPPGLPYAFENPGPDPLEVVSVISPQPGFEADVPPAEPAAPTGRFAVVIVAAEQPPLIVGQHRRGRLLIDPSHGSRFVSQFMAEVDPGRTPPSAYRVEAAMHVLAGRGVAHLEAEDFPLQPGCSLYLPPRGMHGLESSGPGSLQLLCTLCPATSPTTVQEL